MPTKKTTPPEAAPKKAAPKKAAPKKVTPPAEPVEPAVMPVEQTIPASIAPVETVTPPAPVVPTTPAAAPVPPAPPQTPYAPPQPMAPGDERTWAMMSHLTVLVNLLTGFGGPIAALIIYLIYKDRSRLVAYHALQSFVFQLLWWYGGGALAGVIGAVAGVLSWTIIVPIICGPLALLVLLLPLGALIYGVIGAIQTNQGHDFKYWLVGDWVRGTLTGA